MTGHKQSLTQRTQSSQSNAKPPRVKLGDVCHQVRGVSYKPRDAREEFAEGYVPLLRANNIGDGLSHDGLVYVDCKCVSRHQYVRKGDLLVCASSGSRHLVGKAALVDFDGNETFGAFCKVVRPNPLFVNSGYMAQYFQSDAYRITIANKAAGANINNIRSEHLDNLEIPLPSLPEQKRIAAVLDKICEMKRNVEARLQKLDLLVKSRFVEMFGDVVHKPKFSCKTLGEIAAVGSSKRIFQSEYVNQGVPFYRSKEVVELSKGEEITTSLWISRERFEEIKTRFGVPSKGDLLVTAVGTIGQIWIVDGASEFYYKDGNLMCIHPGVHLDSVYLREALIRLIADYKMTMPQGTAYAAFTIEMARKLQLPLPPIGEQRQFAAFVVEVDKSKFVLRETLSRMETLYRAKLQEYFG